MEEMRNSITVSSNIAVRGGFFSESLCEQLPNSRGGVAITFDQVEFRAVARGEQHAFADAGRLAKSRQSRQELDRSIRDLLTHGKGSAVMADSRDD
jgi:hypothetical protein